MTKINKAQLYSDALQAHTKKTKASKVMNELFHAAQDSTGLDKKTLTALKDYRHYKGRGWENGDPLVKEKHELFPDRISGPFRSFKKVIENCAAGDKLDDLKPYLAALKQYGISVSFDKKILKSHVADKEQLEKVLETGSNLQTIICENADEIKFNLAPIADSADICPKKKFKELVSFKYAVREQKSGKRISNAKRETNLFKKALDTDLEEQKNNVL